MWRSGSQERRHAQEDLSLWLWLSGMAMALRLLAALVTGAFQHPQLYEDDAIARSLLAGHGFVYVHHNVPYHSFDAPLYPWICAGIYAVTHGSVTALLLVQMVASAGNVALIGRIAERLWSRRAGMAAAVLMALHPGLVVYASLKAHRLTFDVLSFSLVFWQLLRLQEQPTLRRSLWLGFWIGLSLLERPTAIVFVPLGALWIFLTGDRGQRGVALRRCALMSACALLVISPWLVRSARLQHQFVFLRSTNWEVFWRGNNPLATGHSYIDAEHTVLGSVPPAELAQLRQLSDENAQARWFRDRAWSFIRAHPETFLALTLKKLFYFWWFAPQTGVLYPRWWRYGYQLFYVLMACSALVGASQLVSSRARVQRQMGLLIGALLGSMSLLYSLYYVESRHRWSIEPFLLIFSGIGVTHLADVLRNAVAERRAAHSATGR